MPTYTVENKETEERWNVICSWEELQSVLESDSNLSKVITTPNFVSSLKTHANSNTSDGWKDLLGRVKKGAGRRNTIKT